MNSNRKTVLYIDHFPDIGGGQMSLLTRIDNLDREEWRPIVVAPKTEGEFHTKLDKRDIQVIRLPLNRGDIRNKNEKKVIRQPVEALRNISTVLNASRHLLHTIREHDVALVHSNSFKAAVLSALPARLARVPFVFHARSSRAYSDHGVLDHYVCANATHIVANSEFTADTFGKWSKKTSVIYSPIDLEQFDATTADGTGVREELDVGDEPLVGVVGRLTPRKRQTDLVRAVPDIVKTYPEAQFLLIGGEYEGLDGSYVDELRSLVERLDVSDRVTFTGYREDIQDVMDALDVMVLPSLKEPLGRVVIEALLLETPVVATDAGGIPEIISHGKTGLLVPELDPEAISDAVLRLLNEPETARELASVGRERVRQTFSADTITRQEETLYREILGDTS